MISVLILTYNEEANLADCLNSVRWSDDVVVFDSFSGDETVAIAKAGGARVFQRTFDNYSAQREAARTTVTYKHPWVLALDADERVTEELRDEMLAAVRSNAPPSAFRLRRKDYFMGRWIRHATLYPSWFLRLYRNDAIAYDGRIVHEYPTVNGATAELKGHLIHHSFNKGLGDWLHKHIDYAGLEARENLSELKEPLDWVGMVSSDPLRRRRALKRLSIRAPFRPSLRFLYTYVFRLGFLDGAPGFVYCRLMAIYEYAVVLRLRELKSQKAMRGGFASPIQK
jgi:glycosyltransferase involved in cell wall biosynthesis